MTPVTTIRAATEDDLSALGAAGIGADRLQRRLQLAQSGEETFLVAEVDGHAAGMLSVRWCGGCGGGRPWLYGGEVLPSGGTGASAPGCALPGIIGP